MRHVWAWVGTSQVSNFGIERRRDVSGFIIRLGLRSLVVGWS